MRERGVLGTSGLVLVLIPLVTLLLLSPLLIRTFLLHPFSSPSGSSSPTLLVGDHFFASKYSYGYSRYSFPFSPPLSLLSGRVFASDPERGDMVVFRMPKDPSTDYVKRIIGRPGDRIQMIKGLLHINDIPVRRERIEDFVGTEDNRQIRFKQWRKTLPNGVSHMTLDLVDNGVYDNTKEYQVPAGHYFMMGDNRDDSADSRDESLVGFIPAENLIGRVQMIFWSVGEGGRIRSDRIGMKVR